MIEDKELGLKVAENPIEKRWFDIKKKSEESIFNLKFEIEINEAIIKLADKKITASPNK